MVKQTQTKVERPCLVNMHCRFYYKFINYRVEERTGKTPVHIYLQPKPFSSEKGEEKKNTGKKHFGAFKRRI